MTDQLISFEIAKLAKEKGFTEKVRFYYYDNKIKPFIMDSLEHNTIPWGEQNYNAENPIYFSAPTQSLLQKWLREVHNIHVSPYLTWNLKTWGYRLHFLNSIDIYEESKKRIFHIAEWKSCEEALEEGLKEALKLI